jgi:hypothetical protein
MQVSMNAKQLAKIQRTFNRIKIVLQNQDLIRAMEEWAKLVETAAKKFVPVKTGALRERINHFIFKMTMKEITMKVSTRPKGYKRTKNDIPYEYFLEYGTMPHYVFPTKKMALSWVEDNKRYFSKGHMVSGIMATMFMQRAYLTTRSQGKELVRRALASTVHHANK